MRPRVRHEMKCWPEFFEPTMRGIKRFELRRDDRGGFQVGDEFHLREWNPEAYQHLLSLEHEPPSEEVLARFVQAAYTGREVLVRVDYLMPVEVVDKLMDLEMPYPAEHVIASISLVH